MKGEQQPPPAKRGRYSKKPSKWNDSHVSLLEFNDCFIFKQALLFLGDSLTDVGNIMLVCRSWRELTVACDPVWTRLLIGRYPNLERAKLVEKSSRTFFLRRLQLDCDPRVSVRKQAWPSALRTPSSRLIEQWKPKSVLFFVDILCDSVRIASESYRVRLIVEDDGVHGKVLRPIREVNDHHSDDKSLSSHDDDEEEEEEEEIFHFHDERKFIDVVLRDLKGNVANAAEQLRNSSDTPCKVHLSYQLEGELVPPHNPVVLLSEHRWKLMDWRRTYLYQTDVRGELRDEMYEHDIVEASQYDSSPLLFDPVVDVCVSPRDSLNLGGSHGGMRHYDIRKECILQIGINFENNNGNRATFYPTQLFPTLLSLVEDAIAQ